MLSNIINRIKLPFRQDKELYLSLRQIIGFYPHNISYYKQALMHKSVTRNSRSAGDSDHNQKDGKRKGDTKRTTGNNERLEFLGDAILDAIAGHIVYDHFPGKKEGFLTNTRSKLVKRETLGKLAKEMGITRLIVSTGQNTSHNSYVGGNAFEALVGAIYLDQGYDACMKFMKKRILGELINIDKMAAKEENFKSKLLEWAQKNHISIEFKLLDQLMDSDKNMVFRFEVIAEGLTCGEGSGYTKKEAQQKASKKALEKIRRDSRFVKSIYDAKYKAEKGNEDTGTFDATYDGSDEPTIPRLHESSSVNARPDYLNTEPAESLSEMLATHHDDSFNDSENIIAAAEAAAFAEK